MRMGTEVSRVLQPMLPWKSSSLKFVTTSQEFSDKRSFTLPNVCDQLVVEKSLFLIVLGACVQPSCSIYDIVSFRMREWNGVFFGEC